MKMSNACLYEMTKLAFVAACGVLAVPAETHASHNEQNDFTLLMIDELMKIDIVGSTLIEENMNSVPSSVTVYTGEEIRRMGIHNLEELMNYVPGYQSHRADQSGLSYPFSARGRRTAISGREVLVLLNGQRLNNDWAGGIEYGIPQFSLENVKRIEFIRGPGSALYGSNAFLGVVNIITATDKNNAAIAVGSNESSYGYVNHGYQEGRFNLSSFIKYFRDDGETYDDAWDRFTNAFVTNHDPRDGAEIQLQAQYDNWTINLSHIERHDEGFYQVTSYSDTYNERDYVVDNFSVSYKHNWDQDFATILTTSYRRQEVEVLAQLTPSNVLSTVSSPSSNDSLVMQVPVTEDEFGVLIHNNLKLADKQNVQFGVEYRRPDITNVTAFSNYDLSDIDVPPPQVSTVDYYGAIIPSADIGVESARSIYGVYGQYQFAPWNPITFTLGIRYDDYSDFGSSTNPRFAAVYRFDDDTSMKLLYGRAFRAPTRNDIDAINNTVFVGNPSLRPEVSDTYELILYQKYDHASLAATWFHTKITDSIVQGPMNGVITRYNSDTEESSGIELELIVEPVRNLFVRSGLTYYSEKPDSAFRESDTLAFVILNYQFYKLNLNFSSYYQSEKFMDHNTLGMIELPGYTISNAKVEYEIQRNISIYVEASNLFNKEYYTPSESRLNPVGVPNRSAEWMLGFNWEF
ncbi:MAG TPA: TonB-dependent receptor [Gammaproteobacteria bacterium]